MNQVRSFGRQQLAEFPSGGNAVDSAEEGADLALSVIEFCAAAVKRNYFVTVASKTFS